MLTPPLITTSITARQIKSGDIIVEHAPNERKARTFPVSRVRTDNIGCPGVHIDIKGGGTWCYRDATTSVEVK